MKGYSLTILTVSIVGGIINSLIDSQSQLKKYINYVISLVCVIALISPIASLIGNVSNFKGHINDFIDNVFITEKIENANSLIINTGEEKICEGIKNALIEKYNFDEKEVFVSLDINKANLEAIKIEKINVILTGKSSWHDVNKVEEYLKDIIGGEISVKRK